MAGVRCQTSVAADVSHQPALATGQRDGGLADLHAMQVSVWMPPISVRQRTPCQACCWVQQMDPMHFDACTSEVSAGVEVHRFTSNEPLSMMLMVAACRQG